MRNCHCALRRRRAELNVQSATAVVRRGSLTSLTCHGTSEVLDGGRALLKGVIGSKVSSRTAWAQVESRVWRSRWDPKEWTHHCSLRILSRRAAARPASRRPPAADLSAVGISTESAGTADNKRQGSLQRRDCALVDCARHIELVARSHSCRLLRSQRSRRVSGVRPALPLGIVTDALNDRTAWAF